MSSNADIKSVLEVPYGVQKTKSSSFSLVAFRSQVFVLHGKENNSRAREIDDTLPLQQIHCFTNASVRFFFWLLVPRKYPVWVQLNVSILSLKEKGRMLKNIGVFWTK